MFKLTQSLGYLVSEALILVRFTNAFKSSQAVSCVIVELKTLLIVLIADRFRIFSALTRVTKMCQSVQCIKVPQFFIIQNMKFNFHLYS